MRFAELLDAAGGDREEALRLLFVLARRSAAKPDETVATGPELASMLALLLEGDAAADRGGAWRTAQRLVTVVGSDDVGPTPTAADVVEAIDHLLNDSAPELAPNRDRYDWRDLLGNGGMGRVHRVFDRRLGRSVALKAQHHGVSGLASARRFVLEAELTAQLDHPNIVPLYDFDRGPNGGLYFTMKEVRGRCLADVIDNAQHGVAQEGKDSTSLILPMVRMFRQVCDGVAFAHDQGIAHRDLKPDNIMIGDFGEVQVMDWGLAKRFGDAVGSLAGTPTYMAPEVTRGEVESVEAGPDIYALGATLYQILAFSPPYGGEPKTVLEQVGRAGPQPPSRRAKHPIPVELEAVATRAMSREPSQRFADVASLAADVQAWLDGRPLASLSYGRGALVAKWMRRNRRIVQSIGFTVAIAGILGGIGAIGYVRDITDARDEAHRLQRAAQQERNRAVSAETTARELLVDARLSAARASTETSRYGRAHGLYQSAATELESLGAPQIGTEIGLLDNHERAARPLFTIPPPEEPAQVVLDHANGWLFTLQPGEPAVARLPPLFAEMWRSSVAVPECLASATRWERDTMALYCVNEEGVLRLDLGSGQSARVADAEGAPSAINTPPFTELIFVGSRDPEHRSREPLLRWRAMRPAPGLWKTLYNLDLHGITSARGPWFMAERYARGHGTVLYHADRGAVRSLGLPLAKGSLSTTGRHLATYHEGTYLLTMETVEGGEPLWQFEPESPLVVRNFAPDDLSLFATGETPTILELSAKDGALLRSFDGDTESVQEILPTADLMISRSLDNTICGFSRDKPSGIVEGPVLGLMPPGDVLVVGGGPRTLLFLDIATRKILRRVELPMFEEGESWDAESAQADGVLVVSDQRIVFVRLADGAVEPLVLSDGRPLRSGDRLMDGHVAFCRASEVVLLDPKGEERSLGSIPGEICRDLRITAPEAVFVSNFWGYSVHRLGLGGSGPRWTQQLTHTVFRLSIEAGLVSVGDWTGRVTVYDADSGEVVMTEKVVEGPALGNVMTADGRYVAVGGWDQRVIIVDRETGRPVAEDARHTAPVEWVGWSEDERRLVSADPVAAVVRDLDLPRQLDVAHATLSELAAHPDRVRSRAEWTDSARALAANGLWSEAVSVVDRTVDLDALELARWHWLAGEPARAADLFAKARSGERQRDVYIELCEGAAREEAAGIP